MSRELNIINKGGCGSDSPADPLPAVCWEGAICLVEGAPFFPKIASSAPPPHGKDYNSATINLDGTLRSALDWSREIALAKRMISEGYKILWSLDLGLFDRLEQAITSKPQLMTLLTAVDYFVDEIWPLFPSETLGLSIYRGSLDFPAPSAEEEEGDRQKILERANISLDLLDTLAARAPDDLAIFALVDATSIKNPLLQAKILFSERAEHFRIIAKNSLLPREEISWGGEESPYGFFEEGKESGEEVVRSPTALLLPECDRFDEEFFGDIEKAIDLLLEEKIPFRIIPETILTREWEELDYLIVATKSLDTWGLRKLQGFAAAGGSVIALDGAVDEIETIPFEREVIEKIKGELLR